MREARDLRAELSDLQDRAERVQKRITHLVTKELVDLFGECQIRGLDLEAEGNMPAYSAELRAYYKANIPVDWSDERRAAAFRVLEKFGAGPLIKTVIAVQLPRGERQKATKLRRLLERAGYSYSETLSVPWNTLTAWWRECHEKFPNDPKPPAEVIGAVAGSVVNLVEKKQ